MKPLKELTFTFEVFTLDNIHSCHDKEVCVSDKIYSFEEYKSGKLLEDAINKTTQSLTDEFRNSVIEINIWNNSQEFYKEEILYWDIIREREQLKTKTHSNDMFTTKGTIIPYEVFNDFKEDIRALGHNYISNFTDPNNDHIIVPMPKEELISNMAERLVNGGYMNEFELTRKFSQHLTDCEVEISINVKYITITEEKLF